MPRKQTKKAPKIKKPFAPERDFPHKCNQCAKKQVVMKAIEYLADVRHDGRNYSFTIPDLEIMVCEGCSEKVFTEKVDKQINEAMRKHIGLMSPAEIRDGVRRIGMSQKQVAECLGLAEATLSRWLNETQIQSRSMDRLLRTFFAFPRARTILSSAEPYHSFGKTEFPPGEGGGTKAILFDLNETEFERLEQCRYAQQLIGDSGSLWVSSERQTV